MVWLQAAVEQTPMERGANFERSVLTVGFTMARTEFEAEA
jgi:hypothetical protein